MNEELREIQNSGKGREMMNYELREIKKVEVLEGK